MESGPSVLLDKLKAGIWKILKNEQEESKKKPGKAEDQKNLKQESWTDELRDLAPIDDIEDFDTYEKMLNWAFQNKRVKNIALSGPYGSGKSSIIETYLNRHKKFENSTLRVSMATFACGSSSQKDGRKEMEDLCEERIEISEDEIETAILKQLFYKVNPNIIPQSSYRKLCVRSRKRIITVLFFSLFLATIMTAIILPELCRNYFRLIDRILGGRIFDGPFLRIVEALLFILALAFLIERIYGIELSKIRVKEIKLFSKATIQSQLGDSNSVFNRNLDEILYFFEVTGYRTVFFEDIDRLDNPRVFIHMHELNRLLNNYDMIREKPIRFVYAIKEDFFDAESKTKFFDFIVPVIPVINSTNSCNKIIEYIENSRKRGVDHSISTVFAIEIGLYIYDMRMLLNTFNEFLAYKQALKDQMDDGLKDEKMFAIMVFKGMYPKEFADIQAERGVIKEALIDGKKFAVKKINEIEALVSRKSKEVKYLSKKRNKSSREILKQQVLEFDIVRLNKQKKILQEKSLKDILKEYNAKDVLKEDAYKNKFLVFLLSQGYIDEGYTDYINYFYTEYVGEGTIGASERKFILHVKQKDPLDFDFKIKNPIVVINHFAAEFFESRAMLNFDIMQELIKGEEPEKLRKMIERLSGGQDVCWEFIDKFRVTANPQTASIFIGMIAKEWHGMWEYISENKGIIMMDLHDSSSQNRMGKSRTNIEARERDAKITKKFKFRDTRNEVLGARYYTKLFGRRLYYFKHILLSGDYFVLCAQNNNGCLQRYLESDPTILAKLRVGRKKGSEKELEKLSAALSVLNIKFRNLEFNGMPKKLASMIIGGGYYELNEQMIRAVVSYKSNGNYYADSLEYKPYSTIIELDKEVDWNRVNFSSDGKDDVLNRSWSLLQYVQNDMEEFVNKFVLTRENPHDNVDDIIDMLRRLSGNQILQKKLVKKECFRVDSISDEALIKWKIEKKYWHDLRDILLEEDKVDPNLNIVSQYFASYHLSPILKEYIERHAKKLYRSISGTTYIEPEILEAMEPTLRQ